MSTEQVTPSRRAHIVPGPRQTLFDRMVSALIGGVLGLVAAGLGSGGRSSSAVGCGGTGRQEGPADRGR